jgi:hypothetical protein
VTIFADETAAVADFKDRFAAAPLLSKYLAKVSTDTLYKKLLAAEKQVSRRLRIPLEPTQVFCADDGVTQDQITALNGMPYVTDAGYDYTPDFFRENSWGLIRTRIYPVIAIQAYNFVYFNPGQVIFSVPASWIKLDAQYGMIRLVPNSNAAQLPLNAYLLSAFGGGKTIPQMIHLTYTAGIQNLATNEPDLYDFIVRVAGVLALLDTLPGSSNSISGDGLSQTMAFDLKTFIDNEKGAIELQYKSFFQAFHGVRVGFA